MKNKSINPIISSRLDAILTHKIWGLPIFLAVLFIIFNATFILGEYPMEWIEDGVIALNEWLRSTMTDGWFKSLLTDGIITGIGGVIVFVPKIFILFAFISFLENTGYMDRVAVILDKMMQSIGLNGKAFVPLIMGFGCNVPAIMATRMLESRNERMLTMFIIPFMSCFARLPVYVLLIGAFFPGNPGIMLFAVYLFGIFVSILTAMVLSRTVFKSPINAANIELQVYRRPDFLAIWTVVRKNVGEFLKKIGGIILIGSMIIWTLSYFPRHENVSQREQMELSYLGQIGKAIEPVLAPIGFDWRMSVAALVGISAKELIVSTMSILYLGEEIGESAEEQQRFVQRLAEDPHMSRRNGLAFLVFALLYFPCIAVFGAIKSESGRWRYAFLITLYTTGVAWLAAFATYQLGGLFGL